MNERLYRSRDDRMLAGVAGGLADLWDADPTLIRVLWALLVIFTGGLALVVYIVMAFVVPDEPWAAPPGAFAAAEPGVDPVAGSGADPVAHPAGQATGLRRLVQGGADRLFGSVPKQALQSH
jgi:phage shock protein C